LTGRIFWQFFFLQDKDTKQVYNAAVAEVEKQEVIPKLVKTEKNRFLSWQEAALEDRFWRSCPGIL
jgi:hypothetical protein